MVVKRGVRGGGYIAKFFSNVSALGLLFDAASLSLGAIDTWSDLMVGFEFRDNGQTYFFYGVIILALLGAICESLAFIVSQESRWRLDKWWQWPLYIGMFVPVSPLLPTVAYVLTKVDLGQRDFAEKIDWDDEQRRCTVGHGNNSDDVRGDASRLIDARASASAAEKSMRELDKAITSRLVALMVLNVQAVSESAPMCVLQLISIGLSENPTNMQIFSLALSLVSISGKAFQLCRSFVSSVFVFKIAVLVFDVFSTSFVFCALFSANVPKDTTWLGLNVTNLTWWWLSLKLCCAVAVSSIVITICVNEVRREYIERSNKFSNAFLLGCAFTCLFVLGFTPVALIQETAKLSWFVPLSFTVSADVQDWSRMPLLHAFLWGGDGAQLRETTDWGATFDKLRERVRSIVAALSSPPPPAQQPAPTAAAPAPASAPASLHGRSRFARLRAPPQQQQQQQQPSSTFHDTMRILESFGKPQTLLCRVQQPLLGSRSVMREDNFLLRARHAILVASFANRAGIPDNLVRNYFNYDLRSQQHAAVARLTETLWDREHMNEFDRDFAPIDAPALNWRRFLARTLPRKKDIRSNASSMPWKEVIAFGIIITACLLTSLLSFVYPFLHAAMYAQYFTTMQIICFVPTCVAFAIALCLLPEGVRYLLTSAVFKHDMHRNRDIISTVVDSFFSVPLSVLRAVAIPDEAVPRDAFDAHVSTFLDQRMVGFFGSVGGEFEKLQESFVASQKEEEHDEEIAGAAADALKRE